MRGNGNALADVPPPQMLRVIALAQTCAGVEVKTQITLSKVG